MVQDDTYTITIRYSSKGEVYGDYTVKASNEEELKERLAIAKKALLHEIRD